MPPDALPVYSDNLPDALTERPQWVAWRFEWVGDATADEGGRWTKVPVNVHSGQRASSTNPAHWATLAEALAHAETHGLPGVGFVFAPDDDLCGIDLDKCRDPDTGALDEWAAGIVADLDSYTELSPSGRGVHVIVRAALPLKSGRRKGRLELYHAARYFTVTGHRLPDAPATVRRSQGAVDALYAATFGETESETLGPSPNGHTPSGALTDGDIIKRASEAKNGDKFRRLYFDGDTSDHGDDDSAADLALLGLLTFYTQDEAQLDRLFRRSGLYREKWERADYRERTISKALEREETYGVNGNGARGGANGGASVSPPPVGVEAVEPDSLVIVSLADVESQPVRWLWLRWLARGKVHVLGGHPGDGKSTLTAYLAAALSTGDPLPDGHAPPVVGTLFLLGEDALDDTLRPRLDLHGADVARIDAIQAVSEGGKTRSFDLRRHLDLARDRLLTRRYGLLVIDPLTAFMPKTDRNSEGDVRDVLTPLAALADETGVAVLAVMHVGKPSGAPRRAVQQLLGATAFGAAARVVWMVTEVPGGDDGDGEPARRVLGVVKSNIGPKPAPLEWSRAIDAPVAWHGESAHDVELLVSGAKPAPIEAAKDFLLNALKGGSKTAAGLKQAARGENISEATLRRAGDALGVVRYKQPGVVAGPWLWRLPDGSPQTAGAESTAEAPSEDAHRASSARVSTFGGASANAGKPRRDGKMLTPQRVSIFEGAHLPSLEQIEHLRSDPRFAASVENCLGLTDAEFAGLGRELAAAPADDPDLPLDLAAYAEARRRRENAEVG